MPQYSAGEMIFFQVQSPAVVPGPRLRNFHWVGTWAASNVDGESPQTDGTIVCIFIVAFL